MRGRVERLVPFFLPGRFVERTLPGVREIAADAARVETFQTALGYNQTSVEGYFPLACSQV